jgi:hypothetical protein
MASNKRGDVDTNVTFIFLATPWDANKGAVRKLNTACSLNNTLSKDLIWRVVGRAADFSRAG